MTDAEWEDAVSRLKAAGACKVSRQDRAALGRPRDGISVEFELGGETKRAGWAWDVGSSQKYGMEAAIARALSRLEQWKSEDNAVKGLKPFAEAQGDKIFGG